MRLFAILFLVLAACGAGPSGFTKGPVVHQSSLVSQSSHGTMVQARAMTMAIPGGKNWALRLSVADAGRISDLTAVYAFGTPMPFVFDGEGSGFIPMSRSIFESLAETGFRAEMVDGQELLPIDVPPEAFAQVLKGGAL